MDHLRVDVEGASSGAAGTSPRTPSRENAGAQKRVVMRIEPANCDCGFQQRCRWFG